VSKYTREAGVRSLERKIGAVCRAVAVKVAEHMMNHPEVKGEEVNVKDADKVKAAVRVTEVVDVSNVATIQIPPEFPIVIDENAVEDILGVGFGK
jgi:ATP-dependent Lon protease